MSRDMVLHAMDVQLDLLRWYQTGPGMIYADNIVRTTFISDVPVENHVGAFVHTKMCSADVYGVTNEIVDLIESMAPSMPKFSPLPEDLPSRAGFVYLERPIIMDDKSKKPLVIRALGWTTAWASSYGEGTFVDNPPPNDSLDKPADMLFLMAWTDPSDPRDHMHQDWLESVKLMDGVDIAPHHLLSVVGGMGPIDGESYLSRLEQSDGLTVTEFIFCFFRFVSETWMDTRAINPDRPRRKRAGRHHKAPPAVHMVQLRRAAAHTSGRDSSGDSKTIDWQHRWLVREHWRMQAYGPGRAFRRPVLIFEHIKGPDDKPLLVHENVFSVER